MEQFNTANYAELVGTSKPTESGVYFKKGIYPVLFLNQLKITKSKKTDDVIVVAEFDIVQSEVSIRPAGTQVSEIFNLTGKAKKVHPGKLRSLIAALMGEATPEGNANHEAVSQAEVAEAWSEANPLYGRLVRADCKPREGKLADNGEEFVNTEYFPLPEAMQAQAKEMRVAAGFPAF